MPQERTYDFRRYVDCQAWVNDFDRRFPARRPSFNGYHTSVMFAPRLTGEHSQGLPPGTAAPMYAVAEYEGCPQGWGRGPNDVFIPVPWDVDGKGPGMWYSNQGSNNGYDLAIVYSTTGLNPITGQKADTLRLERYEEQCPKHGIPFVGERFCVECNYKWPPQNYVCPPNHLWWDGFRRPDGQVRQFFFSADELRDVGIAVLGKDRVPAFGFGIFRAKEARPQPVHHDPRRMSFGAGAASAAPAPEELLKAPVVNPDDFACMGEGSLDVVDVHFLNSKPKGAAPSVSVRRSRRGAASVGETRREAIAKTVAVGAGAQVIQGLRPDPKRLDEWETEPAAVIAVYFVPEDVAVKILEGPRRDLVGDREGYLAKIGVPVGTD